MSEKMFGGKTFDERKISEEAGKCGCFPDNNIRKSCETCYHRKDFLKNLKSNELSDEEGLENIDEKTESQN